MSGFTTATVHVAMLNYAYKITPPTLAGTVSSSVNTMHYILFKSLASVIASQLMSQLEMSLEQVFRIAAIFSLGLILLYIALYYILARRKEKNLIETLDKNYPERCNTDIQKVDENIVEKVTRI